MSGIRQANVVVDIGFVDRKYWAFTNQHGQLVRVIAKKIVLQNDATENVTSDGRYYFDESNARISMKDISSPTRSVSSRMPMIVP